VVFRSADPGKKIPENGVFLPLAQGRFPEFWWKTESENGDGPPEAIPPLEHPRITASLSLRMNHECPSMASCRLQEQVVEVQDTSSACTAGRDCTAA